MTDDFEAFLDEVKLVLKNYIKPDRSSHQHSDQKQTAKFIDEIMVSIRKASEALGVDWKLGER